MTTIERTIPEGTNTCLRFFMSNVKDLGDPFTLEEYTANCEKYEKEIEKSMLKTFDRLNIVGTIKTDRYSLPYNRTVDVKMNGSSFVNDAFDVRRFTRTVVKALLAENLFKVRFYVCVNIVPGQFLGFGAVQYHFRYHVSE